MKRFIITVWSILLLAATPASLFISCQKDPYTAEPSTSETCQVELSLDLAPQQNITLTRSLSAVDENRLTDVNIYAFNMKAGIVRHAYVSGKNTLALSLPKGSYDIMAIGNIGYDLGQRNDKELLTIRYSATSESQITANNRLVCTGRKNVTVTGNGSFNLSLVRLCAKLQIAYTVGGNAAGHLTVQSIQLISAPSSCLYFNSSKPEDASHVINYPATIGAATYYMLENRQGTISQITSPSQKSRQKAPALSTYIRITGTYDGKAVCYNVYPGENDTNDFNITRNKSYILNITLLGANPTDFRVSTAELTATPLLANYKLSEDAPSMLTFTCTNNQHNQYSFLYNPTAGSPTVLLDGGQLTPNQPIPFLSGGTSKTSLLTLRSGNQNGQAGVRLMVRDQIGQTVTQQLSTNFLTPNPITISNTAFSANTAHTASYFDLTVEEADYRETFTLQFDPSVSGFRYNNTSLASGTSVSVPPGKARIYYDANSYIGPIRLGVTAKDKYGQSKTYQVSQTIKPLDIKLELGTAMRYISYEVSNGTKTETAIDMTCISDKPVPYNINISYKVSFYEGYNNRNPTHYPNATSGTFTMPAGSTTFTRQIYYQGQGWITQLNGNRLTIVQNGLNVTGPQTIEITASPVPPNNSVTYSLAIEDDGGYRRN